MATLPSETGGKGLPRLLYVFTHSHRPNISSSPDSITAFTESGYHHRDLRRLPLHLCRAVYLFRSSQGSTQSGSSQGPSSQRFDPSRGKERISSWRRAVSSSERWRSWRKRISVPGQPSPVREVEQRFRCRFSRLEGELLSLAFTGSRRPHYSELLRSEPSSRVSVPSARLLFASELRRRIRFTATTPLRRRCAGVPTAAPAAMAFGRRKRQVLGSLGPPCFTILIHSHSFISLLIHEPSSVLLSPHRFASICL